MPTIYFISGVSGVGKTSIISHLKKLLNNQFEVHDFDERGVPTGADHAWRLAETKYWIDFGYQLCQQNKTLVLCGFANPDELETMTKDAPDINAKIILLDADAQLIEKRLRQRNENKAVQDDLKRVTGSQTESFIKNNTEFVPILRNICQKHNCLIIDTSDLTPEEVAEQVSRQIT